MQWSHGRSCRQQKATSTLVWFCILVNAREIVGVHVGACKGNESSTLEISKVLVSVYQKFQGLPQPTRCQC